MTNPLIPGYWCDPYVMKDGNDYYLYPGKESHGWGYDKFHVFHSTNLQDWSEPEVALDFQHLSWADTKAWAPSVNVYKEKYYMFFCGEQQIGVAESDSPKGPFRDILGKPLIRKDEYQCQTIDPDFFIDDNGAPYLLWGQGKCWIALLRDDMRGFAEDPFCLSDQLYRAHGKDPGRFDIFVYNEGAHLKKINGQYMLSWTIADTRDPRYQVVYAVSDHVYGPYRFPEQHELTLSVDGIYGTGHASITDYQGQWYLFYHRLVDPGKHFLREVICSPIRWVDGSMVVNPRET